MWNRLANAIGHIQNHNIGSLSYEEHYRYAYNLVLVSTLYEQPIHIYSPYSTTTVISFTLVCENS